MEDWERSDYFDDTSLFWVPPSPNAPTLDMAILYPGTCLLEGTNVSEGRGTAKPFEYVGAPSLILKLIEQGELHLDDRVSFFLPQFEGGGKEDIRIKHLLTHTSGLPAHRRYYENKLRTRSIIFGSDE